MSAIWGSPTDSNDRFIQKVSNSSAKIFFLLRHFLDELKNAMQNAKELLKKERNADDEKGRHRKS